MDFDKIADTQEYDGNAIDAIFPRKGHQTKKRKLPSLNDPETIILKPLPSQDSSPEDVIRQKDSQDSSQTTFLFTNDNLFKSRKITSSVLFSKYYPPEVLQLTEDELNEINDLYASLQKAQQAADQDKLTQGNVQSLDETCLIERFLREKNHFRETETNCDLVDSPGLAYDSQNRL